MNYMKCERCGSIFDEDDLDYEEWDEFHPYGEGYVPEHWSEPRCPECGSAMVEECSMITVLKKEPGRRGYLAVIENTLESLQKEVGGYIETLTLPGGAVAIFDEEGVLKDEPLNMTVAGHMIVGNILFAGVDGDEFCDVPDACFETFKEARW